MNRTLTIAALALALLVPSAGAQNVQENRDLASIAEEQQHLRRQLQRLRRTMESLMPRLEKEGRTRALELLREGLEHLDERPTETGSLTIDELMDSLGLDELEFATLENILNDLCRGAEDVVPILHSFKNAHHLTAGLGIRQRPVDRVVCRAGRRRGLAHRLVEGVDRRGGLFKVGGLLFGGLPHPGKTDHANNDGTGQQQLQIFHLSCVFKIHSASSTATPSPPARWVTASARLSTSG